MKLIICIDDKNGIAFNKRRQSRDKRIIDKILNLITMWHTALNLYL